MKEIESSGKEGEKNKSETKRATKTKWPSCRKGNRNKKKEKKEMIKKIVQEKDQTKGKESEEIK